MTTRRLSFAVLAVIFGLGMVFLFPRKPGVGEAGIRLALPDRIGDWQGKDVDVTEREREGLAKDTEFARKMYSNTFGDKIYVSIVLSGQDMTNSIHRPERCLPAQNWNVMSSSRVNVPLGPHQSLETTRLTCAGEFMVKAEGAAEAKRTLVHNLNSSWFVGSRDLTADHLQRTWWDIRDRILYGQNQRWAYVTVAANVTEGLERFGRSEAETAKMVEEFIPRILPTFQTLTPASPHS